MRAATADEVTSLRGAVMRYRTSEVTPIASTFRRFRSCEVPRPFALLRCRRPSVLFRLAICLSPALGCATCAPHFPHNAGGMPTNQTTKIVRLFGTITLSRAYGCAYRLTDVFVIQAPSVYIQYDCTDSEHNPSGWMVLPKLQCTGLLNGFDVHHSVIAVCSLCQKCS